MLPASKKSATAQLGAAGERAVGIFLEKQGYKILVYNYRITGGEIDLIATRKDVIAFVEVKVRTTDYFNSSNVIIPSKQRKIILSAKKFCMLHKIIYKILRFDIALLKPNGDDFEITYIPNAFTQREN